MWTLSIHHEAGKSLRKPSLRVLAAVEQARCFAIELLAPAIALVPPVPKVARQAVEHQDGKKCEQEVYDTERHLLYVACTTARDHWLVTGVQPASEFLSDLA